MYREYSKPGTARDYQEKSADGKMNFLKDTVKDTHTHRNRE